MTPSRTITITLDVHLHFCFLWFLKQKKIPNLKNEDTGAYPVLKSTTRMPFQRSICNITILSFFSFSFRWASYVFQKKKIKECVFIGLWYKTKDLTWWYSFFVKESAIWASVGIREISAIYFLMIISLKMDISVWSLLSKICVDECTKP